MGRAACENRSCFVLWIVGHGPFASREDLGPTVRRLLICSVGCAHVLRTRGPGGGAAEGSSSVTGRVWPAAAGEVESVGHGVAILAFPVALPLETVPFLDAFPVDVQWIAVPPPLLECSLSFGVGGSAAP